MAHQRHLGAPPQGTAELVAVPGVDDHQHAPPGIAARQL